ncbi:hypothetical protein GCM10008938_13290 [Deinococcus roseus]|uniref:Uncharacterized protein n=2 Tax=Deinococcus roseus TaxID=392414 RepID=A0ABQ2CWS7_9DEIO|nr:hypothetical protein GCM10008938_13290 [Deinococcus roseus]
MAVIEIQENEQGIPLASWAFQNLLEFIMQQAQNTQLQETAGEAAQVGYLVVGNMPAREITEFHALLLQHIDQVKTLPEAHPEYVQRLKSLAQMISDSFNIS